MADSEAQGWLGRLRAGLGKSAAKIGRDIGDLFTKRRLDDDALEELEDALIAADLGPATAADLIATLRAARFGKDVSDEEVRGILAERVAAILAPTALPLDPVPGDAPFVVLVVGVNGVGKTTTIAKLAAQWQAAGHKPLIAAGDTFRAAAIEQLQIWGSRLAVPVVAKAPGADPAALAFEAHEQALRDGHDVVLIDTAGRLHNKANLMEELAKIGRVLRKRDADAPQAVLLVLDATTGQNAHAQIQAFRDIVAVTGLVITKLDGTAKGGVVVSLAKSFGLPIHAIGVGEGVGDLRPFEPQAFARALLGLTP